MNTDITSDFWFVNGINIAWIHFGRDIGVDPFFSEKEYRLDKDKFIEVLDFVQEQGGNVIRWWYHTNGSTNPIFDKNQKVAKNPVFFHDDVKILLGLAHDRGLKVQLCLWSFDMLKKQWGVDAVANKKLLTHDDFMKAYIDNALLPLVNFIGDHPGLFAYEIFNEPEGMTMQYAANWPDFEERITIKDIQRFINKTVGAVRRAQPNVKITNGALGFLTNIEDKANGFWNAYTDAQLVAQGGDKKGYLDFYNIHFYTWARAKGSPFHNDFDTSKIDKKAIIGEYYPDDISFHLKLGDSDNKLKKIPSKDMGRILVDRKWAGSFIWSWTDRSTVLERERMARIMNTINDRLYQEIDEDKEPSIVLYPNPAKDFIIISGVDIGDSIEIYDSFGRQRTIVVAKKNPEKLWLNDMEEGYYIIKTRDETSKFVIKK